MLGRAWFRPASASCVTWILSENSMHYNLIRRSLSIYSHLHLSRHPGVSIPSSRSQLPGFLSPASNQIIFQPVRTKKIYNKKLISKNLRGDVFEDVGVHLQNPSETAESNVRSTFEEDKELTAEEWDQLTNKIIGYPDSSGRLIKPVNLTSFITQTCITMNSINVGKSWLDYCGFLDSPNAVRLDSVLKMILYIEDYKDQQEFVLKVAWFYLNLGLDGVAVNTQYWDSLTCLAKTDDWEKGVEMILSMKNFQQRRRFEKMLPSAKRENDYVTKQELSVQDLDPYQNYIVKAMVPFCIRALESGRLDYVDKLMTSEKFHEFQVPLRYYLDEAIQHREKLFEFILIYSQDMPDKSAGVMLRHKLYEYFSKYDVHISRDLARVLMDTLYIYNKSNPEKEFSHRTRIDYISGRCTTCGNKLQRTEITDEEYSTLRKAILETVIVADDIYMTSDPKELNRFLREMESEDGKYDVVIDGLNCSYHQTPGIKAGQKPKGLSSRNLLECVAHFYNLGKRVLVIHRPEIKGFPHYLEIDSMSRVMILGSVTKDDPYFILASLYSKSLCVTSDMLRNHMVKLMSKDLYLGQLFNRWQVAHQIYLMGFKTIKRSFTGGPIYLFPPSHDLRPTKAGNHWHIPLLRTGRETNKVQHKTVYFGQSHSWICVGPQLVDMPQVELSFEHISWPEWADTREGTATRDHKTKYFTGNIRNFKNDDNTDSDNIDKDKNYLKYGNKMKKSDNKTDRQSDHFIGKLAGSSKNDRQSDHFIGKLAGSNKNERRSDNFIGKFKESNKNERRSDNFIGKFKESDKNDKDDLIGKSRKLSRKAKKELDNDIDLNKNLLKSLVKKKR